MPYQILQISKNKYMVKNKHNNRIHAYNTSKANAMEQVKLLNYLDAIKHKNIV